MFRKLTAALLLVGAIALTACASTDEHQGDEHDMHSTRVATAALMAKSGSSVAGWVRFESTRAGLHVTAAVTGLTPNAKHAIHIHELGDITSADGKSAGGHYNPEGHPHAGPAAAMRHAGDLGNLTADAQGHAEYDRTFDDITIAGAMNPILGRAVVIHAGEDDLMTQPTGNAGGRIACGTIGIAR